VAYFNVLLGQPAFKPDTPQHKPDLLPLCQPARLNSHTEEAQSLLYR